MSKYDVSSMEVICIGMAAGLSRKLFQSMLDSQDSLVSSARLDPLASAEVNKLRRSK